ncbi:MAG: type III polyketide synthase [Gemmatimonadota bacterium]
MMRIMGIGTAAPEHDAGQAEAAELHAELSGLDRVRARVLRTLYRRSGVERRASVLLERPDGPLMQRQFFYRPVREEGDLGPSTAERMGSYEAHAPRLALQATTRALADAGQDPAGVTHLVSVSCTGFVSPGVDIRLVEELGLDRDVTRTQVGFMGCHGALNGLRVAHGYARAEPESVVLLCAVELCSLHFAYGWDPEVMVANALFADGAGAMVCSGGPPAAGPSGADWTVASTGTVLLDESGDDMTWRIGNNGFRMTLSSRVPDIIGRDLAGWLGSWLGRSGLEPDDVATWAVHPGGPRILDAVEGSLGLDRSRTEAARSVLRGHGNMSSATILFILERLRRERAPLPCVALAFGPGLVAEAALIV